MAAKVFASFLCGIVPSGRKRKTQSKGPKHADNQPVARDSIKLTYYRNSMDNIDELYERYGYSEGPETLYADCVVHRRSKVAKVATNQSNRRSAILLQDYFPHQENVKPQKDTSESFSKMNKEDRCVQSCLHLSALREESMNDSGIVTDNNDSVLSHTHASMNNLVRTTSIQDRAMKLMRDRHKKVAERKRYSANVESLISGKSLDNMDKLKKSVQFASLPDLQDVTEDDGEKAVFSNGAKVERVSSINKKSWEIRRRRKQVLSKNRRSRSYDNLLVTDL